MSNLTLPLPVESRLQTLLETDRGTTVPVDRKDVEALIEISRLYRENTTQLEAKRTTLIRVQEGLELGQKETERMMNCSLAELEKLQADKEKRINSLTKFIAIMIYGLLIAAAAAIALGIYRGTKRVYTLLSPYIR